MRNHDYQCPCGLIFKKWGKLNAHLQSEGHSTGGGMWSYRIERNTKATARIVSSPSPPSLKSEVQDPETDGVNASLKEKNALRRARKKAERAQQSLSEHTFACEVEQKPWSVALKNIFSAEAVNSTAETAPSQTVGANTTDPEQDDIAARRKAKKRAKKARKRKIQKAKRAEDAEKKTVITDNSFSEVAVRNVEVVAAQIPGKLVDKASKRESRKRQRRELDSGDRPFCIDTVGKVLKKRQRRSLSDVVSGPGVVASWFVEDSENKECGVEGCGSSQTDSEEKEQEPLIPDHPPTFSPSPYAVEPEVASAEDSVVGRSIRDLLSSRARSEPQKSRSRSGFLSPDARSGGSAVRELDFVSMGSAPGPDRTKARIVDSGDESDTSSDKESHQSTPWANMAEIPALPDDPVLRLHNEIVSFCSLVGATPSEMEKRDETVQQINSLVHELWPDNDEVRTEVFGSVATGLCLPESDVDVVVLGAPKGAIYKLSSSLQQRGMVKYIEVIDKARVPIIKLQMLDCPFTADVCFNQPSAILTRDMINHYLARFPMARHITLVVKYFLVQRDLNETYRGGMGSFACFLTVVSMVQHHFRRRADQLAPQRKTEKALQRKKKRLRQRFFPTERSVDGLGDETTSAVRTDLGSLLLEYFELYGIRFNYAACCISLRAGGVYRTKASKGWCDRNRPGLLSLENPVDPSMDAGKNSWAIQTVRRAFAHAFRVISATRSANSSKYVDNMGKPSSLLAAIISSQDRLLRSRRRRVKRGNTSHQTQAPALTSLLANAGMMESKDPVSTTSARLPSYGGPVECGLIDFTRSDSENDDEASFQC